MEAKIRALCEQIDELARENAFLKVDLKLAEVQTLEESVPLRLQERLVICEDMLGVNRETELPLIGSEPIRYSLPLGKWTNSCEHARAAWREHCYVKKQQLIVHIGEPNNSHERSLLALVYSLSLSSDISEPQKAQVVNSEPGQSGEDVMAKMVQQATDTESRALAAADSAASEMNEDHE